MEDDLAVLFVLVLGAAVYLFGAYVLHRIGRKFAVGTFGTFCVPVYNIVLLCRCARVSDWYAVGTLATFLAAVLPELDLLIVAITVGSWVNIWGNIARRLGKNLWLWGFGCALLGIPVLFLAFDSSMPDARPEPSSLIYDARVDPPQPEYHSAFVTADPIQDVVTAAPVRPSLRFLTGEYAGQVLELPREGIVIGRDPGRANLVLNAPEISGQHVRIAVDGAFGSRVVLTDLGSRNGTFVRPRDGGTGWIPVHGSYDASDSGPHRVRLANGTTEFEIV